MKNKILLAIYLQTFSVFSQNLLSNGGFENYFSCPTNLDMAIWAKDVVSKYDTPDYFNCNLYPAEAKTGTGSMYLGAVKYTNSVTKEGIVFKLNTSTTIGSAYTLSLDAKYGYKYPTATFNPTTLNGCYKLGLKFLTSNTIPTGTIVYDLIFDTELVAGNSLNPLYYNYTSNYSSTQNYTHLLIQTIPTTKCLGNAAECINTVFFHIIDNVTIYPLTALAETQHYFELDFIKDKVEIYFDTEEVDNSFVIEHSTNANDWKQIKWISPNDFNSESKAITFQTDQFSYGINYYRVVKVNEENERMELDIKSIQVGNLKSIVELKGIQGNQLLFALASTDQELKIKLYNSIGQLLHDESRFVYSTMNQLDLTNFPKGIYFVDFIFSNTQIRKKIVKSE